MTPQPFDFARHRAELQRQLEETRQRYASATFDALMDPAVRAEQQRVRTEVADLEQQLTDLSTAQRVAGARREEERAERDLVQRQAAFVAAMAHMDQAVEYAATLYEAIMEARDAAIACRQAMMARDRALGSGGWLDHKQWDAFNLQPLLSWVEIAMALEMLEEEFNRGEPQLVGGRRRVTCEFVPLVRERAVRLRGKGAEMLRLPPEIVAAMASLEPPADAATGEA